LKEKVLGRITVHAISLESSVSSASSLAALKGEAILHG
jgi:hypothetical protein